MSFSLDPIRALASVPFSTLATTSACGEPDVLRDRSPQLHPPVLRPSTSRSRMRYALERRIVAHRSGNGFRRCPSWPPPRRFLFAPLPTPRRSAWRTRGPSRTSRAARQVRSAEGGSSPAHDGAESAMASCRLIRLAKATSSGPYCAGGAPHCSCDLIESRVPGNGFPPRVGVTFRTGFVQTVVFAAPCGRQFGSRPARGANAAPVGCVDPGSETLKAGLRHKCKRVPATCAILHPRTVTY